jgi:nicotinamidase-related amidase
MTDMNKELTGLLVIDPYNDFISEGGKIWGRVRGVAEANRCVPHMLELIEAARGAGLQVVYGLHHRYRPGDYESWKYLAPNHRTAWHERAFEYGTWGGQIRAGFEPRPGDIVAQEHWLSSAFANTDLHQQLTVHVIQRLIVVGLLANTCIESTVRYAAELGYDVTVVRDAVASTSDDEMHSALEVNIPHYANAVVTTAEIVEAMSSLAPPDQKPARSGAYPV